MIVQEDKREIWLKLVYYGPCARKGEGVFDTLKSIVQLMLDRIRIKPPPPGSSNSPYRD